MRTVKVELEFPVHTNEGETRVHVSTESIVDDENARQAGAEAASVISAFVAGYGEGV